MRRLVLLLALAACRHLPEAAKEVTAPRENQPTVATPAAPPVAEVMVDGGAADAGPVIAPAPVRPTKVKVLVKSAPPKALVIWGKKTLGKTPLAIERPVDSGPLDLIVKSDGYFPVHTRAYTFRNDILSVTLTKLEDRMTILGAREEVLPQPDGGPVPDGGVPVAVPPVVAPGPSAPGPLVPAPGATPPVH